MEKQYVEEAFNRALEKFNELSDDELLKIMTNPEYRGLYHHIQDMTMPVDASEKLPFISSQIAIADFGAITFPLINMARQAGESPRRIIEMASEEMEQTMKLKNYGDGNQ